ncbi:MAG TPA: hypothetical protein ENJ84_04820 [Gammaproteobacteria bacterium]|nr:hypothetical protein [Gammaproteobacteria bacterium]
MFLKLLKGILISLVIAGYPLIVYYLLSHDLPWLGSILVLGIVIWKIKNREYWLQWVTGLLVIASAAGYLLGPVFISKLAPLLIHLSLFYLFWSSLKTTPLIEQYARLDFPELPPGIAEYCRQLTLVWSGFFAVNILICIWFAIHSDDQLWALYNGLIIYLLIGLLVIGEYIWRRIRFPTLEIPPLKQSIENMIKNGHQVWGKQEDPIGQSK